ncbi:hypothetical protein HYW35_00515 [Candidatus Saccharibacteria bacterium]|nr:hypothetical protein [Candidatus Saccharibacteria bacterium]
MSAQEEIQRCLLCSEECNSIFRVACRTEVTVVSALEAMKFPEEDPLTGLDVAKLRIEQTRNVAEYDLRSLGCTLTREQIETNIMQLKEGIATF